MAYAITRHVEGTSNMNHNVMVLTYCLVNKERCQRSGMSPETENAQLRRELEELRLETSQHTQQIFQLKARVAELEFTVHPARKNEKHYQRILEKQFKAGHMHIQSVGYPDITTANAHIEVKRWRDYHQVQGQLAKYNHKEPRPRKCVYFFGPLPDKRRLQLISELMEEARIEMFSFDENDVPYRHIPKDPSTFIMELFRLEMISSDAEAALKATDCYKAFEQWGKTPRGLPHPNCRKAVAAMFHVVFGDTKCVRGHNYTGNVRGWKGFCLKVTSESQAVA